METYYIPSANVGVRVTEFDGRLFTTEAEMEQALQFGPVETRIDVLKTGTFVEAENLFHIQHYGGGTFYNASECVDYIMEDVPEQCLQDGIPGTYTCLNGCSELLPDHCNRSVIMSFLLECSTGSLSPPPTCSNTQ